MTFNSMRETGLEFTELVADGDGSSNTHAQFGVSEGTCFHEDIYASSDVQAAPADFPVWHFISGDKPRINDGSVNSLVVSGLLCYNSGGAVVPATDGWFVMYHIFFTNDILEPFISVMGQAQYEKVSTATLMINSEVQAVKDLLPHQNLLHIGTLVFQTSALFENSYHARIVSQAYGVLTRWSVEGDGSVATPVQFKNDEENPGNDKFYGTTDAGVRGWRGLDPRLFGWGQAIYLHAEDSVTGYKKALPVEPDAAEATYSATGTSADGEMLIKKFVTDVGYPGVNQIKAGPWMFDLWAAVTADRNCSMKVYVYNYASGGAETPLFNFTFAVTAVGIAQYFYNVIQNAIAMLGTDRLSIYCYFINPTLTSTTMYLAVEGDIWKSNVRIPLAEGGGLEQIQSDWNQADNGQVDFIKNKPEIPDAQIQSDWNQADNGQVDYIKNKPEIPDPQIQSDWNQADNGQVDFIKNKPTIPEDYEYWTLVRRAAPVYGNLYNWPAYTDSRNMAPAGWHVPTSEEFRTLIRYIDPTVGTYATVSYTAGIHLKEAGLEHWNSPNTGSVNDLGFNGKGTGNRDYGSSPQFVNLKGHLNLACTTEKDTNDCWIGMSARWLDGLVYFSYAAYGSGIYGMKKNGYAVRCIKDDSTDPGTVTGNDGKIYGTTKIGNQVWMSENSLETKFRNGDIIPGPTFTDNAWAALTTEAYCFYNDDPVNAGDGGMINVYKHDVVEFAGNGAIITIEEISTTRKKVTITI
jgi:uncharacterized protein (TIGR02145 family)